MEKGLPGLRLGVFPIRIDFVYSAKIYINRVLYLVQHNDQQRVFLSKTFNDFLFK